MSRTTGKTEYMKEMARDYVIKRNQEDQKVQYWWLNISSETWNIEEGKKGEKKTISSINDKSCCLDEEADIEFINWLNRYLIDREDNPHFGVPIAEKELVISWLDFQGKEVNNKSLTKTKAEVREKLDKYLPSSYVCNPPVVLKTPTDKQKRSRQCAAWRYPLSKETGEILTDKEGHRLPRILVKKASYDRIYYFYRKSDIPNKPYDKNHIGDSDYVQEAPKDDPEIGYPDIKSITLPRNNPSTVFNIGDFVLVCKPASKKLTGLLKIIKIKDDKITLQIEEIYDEPVPIDNIDSKGNCTEDLNKFLPLDNEEYNNSIRKVIISNNPKYSNLRYSKENLLKDTFVDGHLFDDIDQTLTEKKCLILQGAPGVGKTYLAKRIAYARMGMQDDSRIEFIQFHPNYTYEDFIIGYKPKEGSKLNEEKINNGGFILKDGVFKEFCNEASKSSNSKDYYFIIDEINRGNISKIFGEAFSLIEKDYRNQRIKLSYSQKYFKIPKNVYIIGLMNTADRSLAMIDFALRRRFRFVTLEPAFESDAFKKYQQGINSTTFDKVIERIVDLNKEIKKDPSLGEGFCIGHSYFCNKEDAKDNDRLRRIIDYEIIPMIQEYWFDKEGKYKEEAKKLRDLFK